MASSTLNMAAYHYLLVVLSITLSTIFYGGNGIYLTEPLNGGFSVELIHIDSPKSPFYNSSETPFERMTNAIHRSFNRVNHFYPQENSDCALPQPPITNTNGDFLMKYAIGTPRFDVMAVADTGSDLIWLQCKPCEKCYNQTTPIFDPSKSTSYENVLCSSEGCGLINDHTCRNGPGESKCQYNILYGDGSNSTGDVAYDTLTLETNVTNSPITINGILFGCGHNNDGIFSPNTAGIVGLGAGAYSLPSQLNAVFGNKFSYCLVPLFEHNTTSLLNFGENAVVSGPGTVSTPLASGPSSTFYYLTLEGMTVAGKRLEFESKASSVSNVAGNIIIDSGTTLTHLPVDFYNKLESLVAAQINVERANSPYPSLKLCYKSSPFTFKAPPITVHFTGADIVLNRPNTFVRFAKDVVCFTFSPSSKGSIFGNIAQVNFLVGYDRQKSTVSFKPTECRKF